jgi:hypothetical protein
MATPMDLIDTATEVMTYGGIADADTASGYEDRPMEWCGALTVFTSRAVDDVRRTRRRDAALLGRRARALKRVAR